MENKESIKKIYIDKIKKLKNIKLKLLGKHNVLNATAAIATCLNLGVNQNVIKKSLKKVELIGKSFK